MAELSWASVPTPEASDGYVVSRNLTARAATVALRLAGLLEERCSVESGAGAAASFLRTWSGSALAEESPAPLAQPLECLARYYSLSRAEVDVLLLAGLPEEHEGLASTFRQLSPQGEPRPTVGLAGLVAGEVSDDRTGIRSLLWHGPLVRHGLLHTTGSGTAFEQSLVVADGLWEVLHGMDAWPADLERVEVPPAAPGLSRWLASTPAQRVTQAVRAAQPVTVLLPSGEEGPAVGRCAVVAEDVGMPVIAARAGAAEGRAVRLLAVHAAARGGLPVLVVAVGSGEPSAAATLAADGIPGPLLVCSSPGAVRLGPTRPALSLPVGPVEIADQEDAWRAAVPHRADEVRSLTIRHPLDPTMTAQIAVDLNAHEGLGLEPEEVSAVVRARILVTLPAGMELTTPDVEWHRLVVPDEPAEQLREAVSRLEFQSMVLDEWGFREEARASRGVRMMFTGLPGTGKTLAAEAVASATDTDLLTVDVSRVVSKWIGETEKNLSAAFDAAERTQAVLFLDEADALFGARTEISDAHDRYANLETAYLLQRLDRFDGLAVLATNLRNNIDPAFIRRMDFVIEFEMPDLAARRDLWALHLPDGVTDSDVDVDVLARLYPVAGGAIRNAAIAAAFTAASAGGQIHQRHLVSAMRREYAKAALPFPGEPPRRRLNHV